MAKKVTKVNGMPIVAEAALRGYIGPRLAADAGLNLTAIVKDVTAKTWATDKEKIKVALDAAIKAGGKDGKPLLAKDEDIKDLPEMLDTLNSVAQQVSQVIEAEQPDDNDGNPPPAATDGDGNDGDMVARVQKVLGTMGLSEEQVNTILAAMKPEVKADPPAMDDKGNPIPPKKDEKDMKDMVTRPAMDAAIKTAADAAAARARDETMKTMREIAQAEKDVAPHIGEVTYAADSQPKCAADVYKLALVNATVNGVKVALDGVPPEAYRSMVAMLPKSDATPKDGGPVVHGKQRPRVAQDSSIKPLAERFPNMARIRQAG